ncbi:hypothetical protein M2171_001135 [Bradyrhizobium japonicum USDA 38]|uniref:hypothetical protein n=1 Tax=Bradyrhizobium japonicum TaxID=375 RepID=UPI0018AD52DA|nr:hypothetical protein [Bradyrhizobium japonicum]MCS3892002.1 hypothetical protein [Bradyrhizobium japonicum USDA 38]
MTGWRTLAFHFQLTEEPLKKKLFQLSTHGLRKGIISGLTARQGFVLSPVPEFGSLNAEAFQMGQQMVARADSLGRHVGICGLE